MPRSARTHSETNVYHVTSRGTGFQNIFEDDADRRFLLKRLATSLPESDGELYAWCFMGNHIHLVAHMLLPKLSSYMHAVLACYANWFNRKHGRCGHLFQERFFSEPVEDESHLLSAVRYVHQNPERAHIARTADYPWSSYSEYMGQPTLTSTEVVMHLLGDSEAFEEMHKWFPDSEPWTDCGQNHRLSDKAAAKALLGAFGEDVLSTIPTMSPQQRDALVRYMASVGASPAQLQRMTGIGRTIITRALRQKALH